MKNCRRKFHYMIIPTHYGKCKQLILLMSESKRLRVYSVLHKLYRIILFAPIHPIYARAWGNISRNFFSLEHRSFDFYNDFHRVEIPRYNTSAVSAMSWLSKNVKFVWGNTRVFQFHFQNLRNNLYIYISSAKLESRTSSSSTIEVPSARRRIRAE